MAPCLSGLGPTPEGSVSFLTIAVVGRGLVGLSGLADYRHLTSVDVSHNRLRTLQVARREPHGQPPRDHVLCPARSPRAPREQTSRALFIATTDAGTLRAAAPLHPQGAVQPAPRRARFPSTWRVGAAPCGDRLELHREPPRDRAARAARITPAREQLPALTRRHPVARPPRLPLRRPQPHRRCIRRREAAARLPRPLAKFPHRAARASVDPRDVTPRA